MSGNNNYAVVINFYEKVDPPPTFPTFVDGWHNLGKFVKKLDYFVATQLHSNVDPNGKFKYMNYATFNDTNQVVIKDMTQPTPELLQALGESHGPPGLQTNYPGGYHESLTSGGAIAPDLPAKPASCFLISGFKASSDIDSLDVEKDIELLTGLDIIKDASSTGGKFQVGPWALYRRFTPAIPFKPYDFVFRLELQGLESDLEPAKELVQKLNQAPTVDGIERSITDLYKIDQKDVVSHD
ncbi:uncharacterized protein LOC756131 [Strongylocentrotus purpuratus]|uniref:DUF7153 domain-containing protein n=1 Tax=Strongylocentrotus purpuratus TaxID=7668 RepID=A0A7M7G037_STRPU|nr:uncharacterized protein LOC756131 [Strongylocentrotus purpuratus]|eukprot:XP_001193611.2 PREDICTED: uncharacterized protein LOC756131 [Strongylocentrotus purpuratus]